MIDKEPVLLDIADGIARLRLNRPDAANGMSAELLSALCDAIMVCHGHPDLRVLLLSGGANAADKDRIIGTWKLVAVTYEDAQTKERTPVLGEHPRGYQIATPEGRWIALVTAPASRPSTLGTTCQP